MKVLTVVGARPQFIKAAVVSRWLRRHCSEVLVHTGQHYDHAMSQVFFDELAMPSPDVFLQVGSGSHAWQTAEMMRRLEPVLDAHAPDAVLVYGDTNSTLAGALVAAKDCVPVVHVEAGLRSFDLSMPEEVNRVVTDRLASLCFAPTETAAKQLALEQCPGEVYVAGDVMIDLLLRTSKEVGRAALLDHLRISGEYGVVTVHRASNTRAEDFKRIAEGLSHVKLPLVFPVHPRSHELANEFLGADRARNVHLVAPQSYRDMVALMKGASIVLTDSGGMQKEAYALGVPCVTMRWNTEWTETLQDGWNVLVGTDPAKIVAAAERTRPSAPPRPVYGRGNAGELIADAIVGFGSGVARSMQAC